MKFPERQRSSDIKRNSQNHLFAFNWLVSAFRLVKKIFYHFITVIDVWVIFQMCRGFSFSLHPLKAWNFRCDISFCKRPVNFQTKAKSNNRLNLLLFLLAVEVQCHLSSILSDLSPPNNSGLFRAKDLDHSAMSDFISRY